MYFLGGLITCLDCLLLFFMFNVMDFELRVEEQCQANMETLVSTENVRRP